MRQRVERELAVFPFDEHSIQRERVEMRIEPEVARDALHGGDGAAFAAVDAARPEAAAVPGEERVDERAAHRAAELAVVGETCAEPRKKPGRGRAKPGAVAVWSVRRLSCTTR